MLAIDTQRDRDSDNCRLGVTYFHANEYTEEKDDSNDCN